MTILLLKSRDNYYSPLFTTSFWNYILSRLKSSSQHYNEITKELPIAVWRWEHEKLIHILNKASQSLQMIQHKNLTLTNRNLGSLTKNQITIHIHQKQLYPHSLHQKSKKQKQKTSKYKAIHWIAVRGSAAEILPQGPFAGETPRRVQNFPTLKSPVLAQHHLIVLASVLVLVQEMIHGLLQSVGVWLRATDAPRQEWNKQANNY